MARMVLDSWGLIAFFEDSPAAEMVESLLLDGERGKHQLLLSVLDWWEIYSSIMSRVSQAAAEDKMQQISELPLQIIALGDDLALVRQAAIYRASHNLVPSCAFAAALAKTRKACLVTGDASFRVLVDQIKIRWLV